MNNFSDGTSESGYQYASGHTNASRSGGGQADADGNGNGNGNDSISGDSALTQQGLQTLFAAFGSVVDPSSAAASAASARASASTSAAPVQTYADATGTSSSQMSTSTSASSSFGPTGECRRIAGKALPHACGIPTATTAAGVNAKNATADSSSTLPVLDDTTLLSLLSQSMAAKANGTAPASAGAGSSNMNCDQQQTQAQNTDPASFQWNPSLTNIMASASSQGNEIPMDANPVDNATIDQSTPRFTVEEERRELATLSIDEIISVEKDLRGVQANFGGMKLSS